MFPACKGHLVYLLQAYIAGHQTPEGNLQLLDEMIACRADLAHMLGYSSYAHFKCYQNTLAEVGILGSQKDISMSWFEIQC